jgi:hypothetical protein
VGGIRIFFGAPSDGDHHAELAQLRMAAAFAAAHYGAEFEIVTGEDWPGHGLSTWRGLSLAAWVRKTIQHDVDAVVTVYGPSWGCGREDALAGRLPRLVLVHRSVGGLTNAIGGDGTGWLSVTVYDQPAELITALADWFEAYINEMRNSLARRTRRGLATRPWRLRTHRMWAMTADDSKRAIAGQLGMTSAQLSSALQDDVRYARLDIEDAVWLTDELKQMESENRRARLEAVLSGLVPRERRAFESASHIRRWDYETAIAVAKHGLELRERARMLETAAAGGERWKLRLTSRNAWFAIHEDLCLRAPGS